MGKFIDSAKGFKSVETNDTAVTIETPGWLGTTEGTDSLMQLDGDTFAGTDGQRYRLAGADAPETTKVTAGRRTVDIQEGELGGEETTRAVNAVLQQGGFNRVIDTGEEDSYGRKIVRFTNDRGQDVTQELYRAGILKPDRYTPEEMVDAFQQGEAARELGISTGYEDIVQELDNAIQSQRLKSASGMQLFGMNAQDAAEYAAGKYSPLRGIYTGVNFQDADRDINNVAHNSIGASAYTGWLGMKEGFYGFGQMLGDSMGIDVAKDWGDAGIAYTEQEMAQLPEIPNLSFDDVNGVMDFAQYLGNNAAMSAPYLALTATGAVLAPVTGGGSLVVAGAAIAPTSAVYAGQVWNEMEGEKNAGAAFAAGIAAGALDRLGLKGIVKPTQMLSKTGQRLAADHLVNTGQAASLQAAETMILQATKQETLALMKHAAKAAGDQATSVVNRGNMIRDVAKGTAMGSVSEGLTEAGQEAIQYTTAALASDREFNQWELEDRIRDAVLAGGTLGGGFGSAGSVINYAGRDAEIRNLQKAELNTLNQINQIRETMRQEGKPLKTVDTIRKEIQNDVASWREEQQELAESEQPGKAKKSRLGSFGKRAFRHEKNKRGLANTFKDINSIPDALAKASNGIAKLYQASSTTTFSPTELANSAYGGTLQAIRALVGQTRGVINPGRSFEAHLDQVHSELAQQIYMPNVMKRFGVADSMFSGKERNRVSKLITTAAQQGWLEQYRNGESIFSAPQEIKDAMPAIDQTARELETMADNMLDVQNQALINAGQEPIGRIEGWWYKHRSFDPKKVQKNKAAWVAFMKQHTSLTPEEINDFYTRIVGGDVGTVQDYFSHVRGVEFVPEHHKRREAKLSEQPGFEQFGQDDMFATMDNAALSAARFSTLREFFGSGGQNLDYLFDQLEQQGMSPDKVDEVAWYTKSIIDAATGNFNRIQNPTWAETQMFASTWSIFAGLPMSVLSSMPESVIVNMGLDKGEIGASINKASKQLAKVFGDQFGRGLVDSAKGGMGRAIDPSNPDREIDPEELRLNKAGLYWQPSQVAKRLGVGNTNINYQWLQDAFFKGTGISGMTQAQRRAAGAITTDFVANRLAELGEVADLRNLNERQQFVYNQLAELGIDVETMVELFKDWGNDVAMLDYVGDQRSIPPEVMKIVDQNMQDAVYNFTTQRIQNPGAANRPLFFQDPHWQLLTQFNGFISTFTANVVPKLWNDYIKRGTPAVKYNTFALILAMTAMGGASQWLKDQIKYGKNSPYLKDYQFAQRALYSSGVLGQAERVADLAFPLYGSRPGSTTDWLISSLVGEAGPTVRNVGNVLDIVGAAGEGDVARAVDKGFSVTPLIAPFGRWRKGLSSTVAGEGFEEGFNYYEDI